MMRAPIMFAALLLGSLPAAAIAQPQPSSQLTYTQPLSRNDVQTVQQRLRSVGAYRGPIDGNWGPESAAALERYQQTHGLQVTGEMNQATAATLGIGPFAMNGSTGQAAPSADALSPNEIRDVQARLAALGFYHNPRDGVWGPATQDAIARFQQSRGLQPNSQLNVATLAALGVSPRSVAARQFDERRPALAQAAPAGSPNCGTPYHWNACPDWRR